MRTTYSAERAAFSQRAHLCAQRVFYPAMYPTIAIAFEDTVKTIQDLEYAIDCQLALSSPDFRAPIRVSVQERFRRPEEMHWGDVTITEWNLASDQPSELHKLGAQLFVYGFYDEHRDDLVFATAIDVLVMQTLLVREILPFVRKSRGDQHFIGVQYRDLNRAGAVRYTHRRDVP